MNRIFLIALFAVVQASSAAPTTAPSEIGHGNRVLVISIDGCRPDVALRADMPNFRKLMHNGSYSMYARTTDIAITLPSHTSMITGVTPAKHTITWNDDADEKFFHYPAFPTLMELAHDHGLTTSLIAAKSKFIALAKPGTIDFESIPARGKTTDAHTTAENAVQIIKAHQPQVMMLHFGDADAVGHAIGWGTPQQVATLEKIDAEIGNVLDALRSAGVYDQTLIIVTADHGGFGRVHGENDLRAAFIPWIVDGPNVKKDYDLTRVKDLGIRTEDTFATSAAFLGIPLDKQIDGNPVDDIWERDELVHDVESKDPKKPDNVRAINTIATLHDAMKK